MSTRWRLTRHWTCGVVVLASTLVVAACADDQTSAEKANTASSVSVPHGTPSTSQADPRSTVAKTAPKKVWPRWDPRDVSKLPTSADGEVHALPAVITPPASSPVLADDPIKRAVFAVAQGDVVQLLSPNGGWRTVALGGKHPGLQLSPGGTKLAISYYGDERSEVTVHDLRTGMVRTLRPPAGFHRSDDTEWTFLTEEQLLLSGAKSYVVAVNSGASEAVPYPVGLSRAIDPDGNVLVSSQWGSPKLLTDFRGEPPHEVSMTSTGRLSSIRADRDTVVGTSYDNGPFAVVVADRKTLTPRAVLPVLDHQGNYSSWGLVTLALASDGRVLLRVATIGRGQSGFRVVAWNPRNGDLSVLSSIKLPATASVAFAEGLLRGPPED